MPAISVNEPSLAVKVRALRIIKEALCREPSAPVIPAKAGIGGATVETRGCPGADGERACVHSRGAGEPGASGEVAQPGRGAHSRVAAGGDGLEQLST